MDETQTTLKHRPTTLRQIAQYVDRHAQYFGFYPNGLRLRPEEWAGIMNDPSIMKTGYRVLEPKKHPELYGMAIVIDSDLPKESHL